jgi:hypothetical protein
MLPPVKKPGNLHGLFYLEMRSAILETASSFDRLQRAENQARVMRISAWNACASPAESPPAMKGIVPSGSSGCFRRRPRERDRTTNPYDRPNHPGYERMVRLHTVACCEPSFWPVTTAPRRWPFMIISSHLTSFEPRGRAQYLIQHYCWICLNPKEAENQELARDVLAIIPVFFG